MSIQIHRRSNFRHSPDRHASALIALHWLTLILIVAVYACIEFRVLYAKGSDPREALKAWHFTLGILVLLISTARLLVRAMAGPVPPIEPPPPLWQRLLSGAVHVALYGLLLAMPLVGWLTLSASGKPIPFFGFAWPALIGENKDLARTLKELHETAGTVGYVLIGLHALAAVWHHHVVRDNTLLRMWPTRR